MGWGGEITQVAIANFETNRRNSSRPASLDKSNDSESEESITHENFMKQMEQSMATA